MVKIGSPIVDYRRLTVADFQHLADTPPEVEWFANLDNDATRRAHANAPLSYRLV